MNNLKGKRILFIGNGFYNYEKNIEQEFVKRGAEVFYFSSSINITKYIFLLKILTLILSDRQLFSLLSKKLLKVIKEQPDTIDYIFINKGVSFRKKHVELLNEKYPNVPTVLYFWDSLNRVENKDLLLSSYSGIMTFDRLDSLRYNIKFRPLFYVIEDKVPCSDIKYDISFVGNMHSIRFAVLRKIKRMLISNGINYNFKLYINKYIYFIQKYIFHTISNEDDDILTTSVIPYKDYLNISRHSNVILDISHPLQSGLTIRSIESIGLCKKILTTNEDIVNYNLPETMVQHLSQKGTELDLEFIKNRNNEQYDREMYSLSSFVDDIIQMWCNIK